MAMRTSLSALSFALLSIALVGEPAGVRAGTLYKSVDPQGRVAFSDTPIDGNVIIERITSSESANSPGSRAPPVNLALADSLDEAVVQANAKVDLAEHALAMARKSVVEDNPGALAGERLSRADSQLLAFYKRDVQNARRNLLRVLKQPNNAPQRPFA
jgi:hypothetical protein